MYHAVGRRGPGGLQFYFGFSFLPLNPNAENSVLFNIKNSVPRMFPLLPLGLPFMSSPLCPFVCLYTENNSWNVRCVLVIIISEWWNRDHFFHWLFVLFFFFLYCWNIFTVTMYSIYYINKINILKERSHDMEEKGKANFVFPLKSKMWVRAAILWSLTPTAAVSGFAQSQRLLLRVAEARYSSDEVRQDESRAVQHRTKVCVHVDGRGCLCSATV